MSMLKKLAVVLAVDVAVLLVEVAVVVAVEVAVAIYIFLPKAIPFTPIDLPI